MGRVSRESVDNHRGRLLQEDRFLSSKLKVEPEQIAAMNIREARGTSSMTPSPTLRSQGMWAPPSRATSRPSKVGWNDIELPKKVRIYGADETSTIENEVTPVIHEDHFAERDLGVLEARYVLVVEPKVARRAPVHPVGSHTVLQHAVRPTPGVGDAPSAHLICLSVEVNSSSRGMNESMPIAQRQRKNRSVSACEKIPRPKNKTY